MSDLARRFYADLVTAKGGIRDTSCWGNGDGWRLSTSSPSRP